MRNSFSKTVLYLQQLFFQNNYFSRAKLLPSSHFLGIESSLGQYLFGTATFLEEDLFRMKISTEELLFQSRCFCTAWTFLEEQHFGKSLFFRKTLFRITYSFWGATFLERLLFQKTLFSTAVSLSEELLFYNIIFQRSYYFTAMLPFYNYTSYFPVSITKWAQC